MLILTTVLILLCGITILSCSGEKADHSYNSPTVIIHHKAIKVEIADTPAKRQAGLMARKKLDLNSGMLFLFEKPGYQTFWMKDCYISLDIIYILDNKIVNIYSSVPPCKSTPCELYPSATLVDMVLEVNGGYTQKHNINIGDTIQLKGLRD